MLSRFTIAVVCVFFASSASAGAAVSTGHSGWLWGSPTPQGNDLTALEFSGNLGYATGGFGTLLKTTDSGSNWSAIRTGMTNDFSKLDMIDEDSIVLGSLCSLRRTDDGGETFRRLPFTASESRCQRRLTSMSFPDANVGYLLLEDGAVLKTADGGKSFSTPSAIATNGGSLTAINFSTPTVGLVTTTNGEVLRTVDGGQSWSSEFDIDKSLYGVYFSGLNAVAVGDDGAYVYSNDAGDTWTRAPVPAPTTPPQPPFADLVSVRCNGAGTCLMITRDSTIARTTDNGTTLTLTGDSGAAVDFASATRAVSVSGLGVTQISDDGGASFAGISAPLALGSIIRVRATSANVAYAAASNGGLARTRDGGEKWERLGLPASEDVIDISFPRSDLGYALDGAGGLFRTENGGDTWGILDTGSTERPNAVYAPDGSKVFLIGPRGIRQSTNAGETFKQHTHPDVRVRTLTDVDPAGSAVAVFGPRVIAVSKNEGKTWRRVSRPTQKAEVQDVDFVSAKGGWALLTDGRLFLTKNGGKTWSESIALGSSRGRDVSFADMRNGWLTVDGGSGEDVLRTDDGGFTWRPQVVGAAGLGSIAAAAPRVAFASFIAFPGLVHTTSGGDAGAKSTLSLTTATTRLEKRRVIDVKGKLRPASGGEAVFVSFRNLKGGRWRRLNPTVEDDGRFSVRRRVSKGTVFVAQWTGNADTNSASSRPLMVTVGR